MFGLPESANLMSKLPLPIVIAGYSLDMKFVHADKIRASLNFSVFRVRLMRETSYGDVNSLPQAG